MALSIPYPEEFDCLSNRDWEAPHATTTLPARATLSGCPRRLRFQFEHAAFIIDLVREPPVWLGPTIQSLAELLRLEPNWDSYGGQPIDSRCVVAALELALNVFQDDTPIPSFVPTSSGYVQIEWHTAGIDLELEFLSATRVRGVFEDRYSGVSWEKDLTFDRQPLTEAIAMLSQRM